MKIAAVLYMPALHLGYRNFLTSNGRRFDAIFLISDSLKVLDPELPWLFEKDLRAMPVDEMQTALAAQSYVNEVKILNENNLKGFDLVVVPDNDEIVETILLKLYPSIELQKESWFIRWGRKTVLSKREAVPTARISFEKFDKETMQKCFAIGGKSSDWWRQVGVVLFPLNADPIEMFNRHLPNQQSPYILGDPRTNFKPGENIDLSTAGHAEAGAIAYAARKGISLEGASIYVTTLPCPPCAWSIVLSGIKKVYYTEGYSLVGSVEAFKDHGIELIFVDIPN